MVSACAPTEPQSVDSSDRAPTPVTVPSVSSQLPLVQNPSIPARLVWSIRLAVSGGIAGQSREIAVDGVTGQLVLTDHGTGRRDERLLGDSEQSQLAQLVQALPKELSSRTSNECNDCFSYELVVSRDGQAHSAQLESVTLANSECAELIARLVALRVPPAIAHP